MRSQTAEAPFLSRSFSSFFGGRTNSPSHSEQPPVSPTESTQSTHLPTNSNDSTPERSSRDHHKERTLLVKKPSLRRKSSSRFSLSISSHSHDKPNRRRADSGASRTSGPSADGGSISDVQAAVALSFSSTAPPVSLSTSYPPSNHRRISKMLSRGAVTPVSGYPVAMTGSGPGMLGGATIAQQNELAIVHQHIQDTVNKRISTLDYLRKAHEGRLYWLNTLLFDKPDLQRMSYFDPRKLGRRATNYLLLGISLPAVVDLNSSTPTEFLRSLNTLLTEFDAFQQIHTENGVATTSLARARLPQMFRRAAAPVSKGRRSSSAAGRDADIGIGYSLEQVDSNASGAGPGVNGGTGGAAPGVTVPGGPAGAAASAPTSTPEGVMAFAASEVDLLPGEEYTYLLTPTLPFDPDFFETFATLCDVLIDTYSRLLTLLPTPRECGGSVGELFAKVDSRIRKLFIQGVVKEFDEVTRAGEKVELASVGKVVLSGLM
ncbi:hypothetical protein VTJ83DRAFT_3610 [Remersonia thermophila]|uniref:Uncharacterized protein n=1 Tax=Remersonia thermophila TaxID=72144 RepID=A0ABR4DEM1_9PEZI